MTSQNAVFKADAVAVKIEGNSLSDLFARTCGVLENTVFKADVIAVNKQALASEGAALSAVIHHFFCKVR